MLKTIKRRLIAYFSIAFLTVSLAICCYYFYMNYRIQEEELIQNVTNNIDYFQSNINKMLMRCEQFSDKIYYDNNIAKVLIRKYVPEKSYYNIDRDLVDAIGDISLYLDNDIIAKYIRGMIIKGNNGEVIKYGEDADYVNVSELESMEWFRENKTNNYVEWLPMIENTSKVSKIKYQIPIARQIITSYTYKSIGWQFISISPSIIRDTVEDYELQNDDILLIYDSDYNCMYSNKTELFGTNLEDTISAWGENRRVNYNDQTWFMVKNHSEYSGITIVQLIDYKVFRKQIDLLIKSTSVVILIVLIVIFSMTIVLSNSLTKPISRITGKMKLISKGDFTVDKSLEGDDEIGTLGQGINKLAQSVDLLMKQIREEEAKKKELEYKTLQSQINPHFVYNVLNSVRIMAKLQGADSVCTMVENFGELLKEVSKGVDDKIPLEKEFELTERYVYLQKIRKKGLIRTEYEIEKGCEKCLIIKFLLQPLVENAILHGFEGKKGMEFIHISAHRSGDDLLILIHDNGRGMTEEDIAGLFESNSDEKVQYNKVGVKNIQERIQLLYGPQYGLTYESKVDEYTIVKVILPFEVERGEDNVQISTD
ncbi:MAG: histidine kinase [Lachnospiraceae bacterium]|nr:histidine kinase [Lachnospiraceae bacterium]